MKSNENVSTKQRLEYINFLNVFSAFAVVMLHTNEVIHQFSYGSYWLSANIIEGIMYFAVPVFLFISSGTLLDYRERYTTEIFFKKRIHKTLIPFIIWSISAMMAQIVLGGGTAERITSIKDVTPWYIIDGIINFKFLSIYSFFGYLFGLYLAMPVLSNIKNKIETFKYMAVVGLIFNCGIPLIFNIFEVQYSFTVFELCFGYTIYLPIGYLLVKLEFTKKQRLGIYIAGLFGMVVHIVGTYFLSIRDGNINGLFKGYTNLPGLLYSIAVFVFIKNAYPYLAKKITKLSSLIKKLSKYTFGVYLVHIYVIRAIKIALNPDIYSIAWRLLAPLVVFPISVLIVWLIKLSKIGRIMIPD